MDESVRVTRIPTDLPFDILHGTFKRQRFAPHIHDTYAIGAIERGASKSLIGKCERLHLPGGVILIEPGVVHTGEPADDDGWTYRMMYLPKELVSACAMSEQEQPQFAASSFMDPLMAASIMQVHSLLEAKVDLLEKESALTALLHTMLARYRNVAAPRLGAAPTAALMRVRDYLIAHSAETVRLSTLAALAGLSPFHLIRQYRKAFGVPPYAYLELIRVMKAKSMLAAGARISDVAFATGFSDQSHLTRRFKRVYGFTPGRYVTGGSTTGARR